MSDDQQQNIRPPAVHYMSEPELNEPEHDNMVSVHNSTDTALTDLVNNPNISDLFQRRENTSDDVDESAWRLSRARFNLDNDTSDGTNPTESARSKRHIKWKQSFDTMNRNQHNIKKKSKAPPYTDTPNHSIRRIRESRWSITQQSDDRERDELPWTTKYEDLITGWVQDAEHRASLHEKKGRSYRIIYYALSTPGIILPIVMSTVGNDIRLYSLLLYNMVLILSGIISGLASFIDASKKSTSHLEASNRYMEYTNVICKELSKPRKYRMAADAFLEHTLERYNRNLVQSPDI